MLNKIIVSLLVLFSLPGAAAQTVMEIVPLFNRPASELQPLIAPLLEPADTVVGNDFNLIIKTTPARLAEIKALVKKLDIALNNLSIRVIQSKDKTADQLNAGLGVDVNISINNPGAIAGQIAGQLEQNQQHISSQGQQVIRTLEGRPAYIKVGGNHPVRYNAIYGSGYGQRTMSGTPQYIEATTGFAVLPRLNGEQVTLEISPWSDQMQNNGSIETQSAQTTVTAKLGQWVEIGSVNEESHSSGSGLLRVEQGSRQNVVHILIQVEKNH